MITESDKTIMRMFSDAYGPSIIAGGYIRDQVYGKTPKDVDFFVQVQDGFEPKKGLKVLKGQFNALKGFLKPEPRLERAQLYISGRRDRRVVNAAFNYNVEDFFCHFEVVDGRVQHNDYARSAYGITDDIIAVVQGYYDRFAASAEAANKYHNYMEVVEYLRTDVWCGPPQLRTDATHASAYAELAARLPRERGIVGVAEFKVYGKVVNVIWVNKDPIEVLNDFDFGINKVYYDGADVHFTPHFVSDRICNRLTSTVPQWTNDNRLVDRAFRLSEKLGLESPRQIIEARV